MARLSSSTECRLTAELVSAPKNETRMDKLPKDLARIVDDLCRKGDQFAGMDQYDDAIEQYTAAWDLLPAPKEQWLAATWILLSAGDVYFRNQEYAAGAEALVDAFDFPNGEGNPFLLLRLGQCLFELGELNDAADALEEAFRLGGEAVFEDEDAKYFGFVKAQLKTMSVQSKMPGGRFHHPLE
jgi:tetratricopeptide (TPR) repeat protein